MPSMTSPSRCRSAPSSAIVPLADADVEALVDPGARVEDVGALDQDVGGGRFAVVELAHAGIGVEMAGCGALAAGEQLVEDGHPDDDAGLDLLADHGLRGVDDLGGELDAAVDRARVHQDLAGRRGGGR